MAGNSLNGTTKSCGCYRTEVAYPKFHEARKSSLVERTKLDVLTSKPTRRSTTGIRGVYFNKKRGSYQAYIQFQGINTYLGSFKSIDEAAAARQDAEEKYFTPLLEKYKSRLTSKK